MPSRVLVSWSNTPTRVLIYNISKQVKSNQSKAKQSKANQIKAYHLFLSANLKHIHCYGNTNIHDKLQPELDGDSLQLYAELFTDSLIFLKWKDI